MLNNLGVIYHNQGDAEAAEDYHSRSLKIRKEINDSIGIANSFNNLGMIYYRKHNYDKALEFFSKSLKIREALNYKPGLAVSFQNIGGVYRNTNNYEKALEYLKKSLALRRELNQQVTVSQSLNTISGVYFSLQNYKLAKAYCDSALVIASENKSPTFIKDVEAMQAKIDSAMGNYKGAFEHYQKYIFYRDSIVNDETRKATIKSQMKYEFEKKEAATKAEQEKKDALTQAEIRKQKIIRNSVGGGLAIVLLFSVLVYRQRNKISKEKKRSDELLLNILPSEVAEELKEKGYADAKQFDEVTVLFTDFKGFTAIAEKLSAQDLVKEINECFSAFDKICEQYGIEKIKTIGDAYMAAGGLPVVNKTHATDVVKAALEMRDFMKNKTFEIRIGIHTGNVIAGIVGIKKFQYDIWGDTVNTASRMESSGEVGKINISETTYQLVKDKFNCEYRGEVEAKGKGKVKMYFVS
jgi:class 3 adenylate cyclase